LDEIIAIRANDPRQMKPGQETTLVNSVFKNDKFFRQAETSQKVRNAMQSRFFDASIENMLLMFCEKIDQELEEASRVQRKRVTSEDLVDRYGVKNPGFINFEEFMDLYKNHVHYADDNNFMKPMPETNKLQGLFNTLDPD